MVIQTFLPLLHAARRRIVTISSVAGKLSMAFNGAHYGPNTRWKGCTTPCGWRLHPCGIHVSLVEPG
jgi:NAD(P)-dependent dehydrogenase (short-subunit alcohol dehydrogenase family)